MAENNQDQQGTSFKNAQELTDFIMDLKGQLDNVQQTVDKIQPADEKNENQSNEENEGQKDQDEMTEEEVNEIDQMLQSE